MRTPDGRWLDVELVGVEDDAGVLKASFELDVHDWHWAERVGVFHTDRSVGGERPFEPDQPILVEAVLGPG